MINAEYDDRKYDIYDTSVTEWTTILKLSTELDFVEAKNFAIRGLQGCTLEIAERVSIYQKYHADVAYLIPLFAELSIRSDGPTDEESEKMGAKTSLMVFRVRERLRSGKSDTVDLATAIEAISAAVGHSLNVSSPATNVSTGALVFVPMCERSIFY